MSTSREEERLSALMLFRSLGPKEAGEINTIMESIEIGDGDRLFEEGDAGDALYIIRDGSIEIRKRSPEGEETAIATLGKFAILGEMSLITNAPRNAAAVAVAPTRLFRIAKDAFVDLLEKDCLPAYKVCLAIARFLAHRLGKIDDKLMELLGTGSPTEGKASLRALTDFKAKLFTQWKEG